MTRAKGIETNDLPMKCKPFRCVMTRKKGIETSQGEVYYCKNVNDLHKRV